MRPENTNQQDVIDTLLDKAWEIPPSHLEQQLMAIPTQIVLAQNRQLDRISIFLNSILMLWGAGMLMFFWTPVRAMLSTFTQGALGVSALSPQMLMHPIVGIIVLVILLFGWVWVDMEKHPGVIKV